MTISIGLAFLNFKNSYLSKKQSMRYHPIPASVYKQNRTRFANALQSKSLAVFNSNDIYPISADSTLPFQQHRDIFYLSGIDQEESILVIFPDAQEEKHREILFVRETNEHIAVWEGAKLTKAQARERSGIQTVYWLDEFKRIFQELSAQCNCFYFNTNEHYRQAVETQTREDRFIDWCKKTYPAHSVGKSNPILQQLRSVKSPEEIEQIQQACDITEKGFRRILSFIKPGVWEYEIEAEFVHEFIRNRSKGFAYTPIIAAGENANVLHYIENNKQCHKGDLVLMDVAAEYGNYSSDMTRTVPVSGRFTSRQKKVYESVLKVKKEATQLLKPGVIWKEFHIDVGTLATIYSVESDAEETIKNRMASEVRSDGKPLFNLASGISLMLFYAFAMQCMSTLAIVKKETNSWKWPMIQLFGMSILAYVIAFSTYQILA